MPVLALTGVTGFIGRALLARLLHDLPESDFRVLVRGRGRLGRLAGERVEEIDGGLDDDEALASLVSDADTVIHLAGAIAGSRREDFDQVNIDGSRRLAEAVALRSPGAHAVLVSSLAARRPELSWYAASKAGAEHAWTETLGDRQSILRPPAVYGPDDPALADFWNALARGWLIRLGPRDARFSLVHVDDVVEALGRLTVHGPTGATLSLAGPQPDGGWRWSGLAEVAARVRGGPIRTLAVPGGLLGLVGATALAVQRLRGARALLSPGKVRELRHLDWVCDNLALSAHLDWAPDRDLADALPTLPGWTSA